ncbi:MAG: hypothetical protein ACN4GG_07825 [Akkermansiaceae bacterium]
MKNSLDASPTISSMKLILAFTFSAIVGLFSLSSCAPAPVVSLHETGWQVPAVSAPDQLGNSISLESRTAGPWAIVFFYPKADTPG